MTPRRIASQQRAHVPHSATGDSRKDALWGCHPHGKAQSATTTSRKSALWGLTLTEKRILHQRRHRDVTERRILHASGGCAERPFSPICVHSCIPTAARATGRGHGSHDVDGPMAPVMLRCPDLRSMPPGR